MPELPEIASRARELHAEVVGKSIASLKVLQPKCLNMAVPDFQSALTGARIEEVSYHGKWIYFRTSQGWLLLNLGMGGAILLVSPTSLPEKHRLLIDFSDQTCLAINFSWFGYAHFAHLNRLQEHEMTAKLGPNAIDLTFEQFRDLIKGSRIRVKAFLLDQSKIAGIGNAYIHDILFLAHLHPQRTLDSLNEEDIRLLYEGIRAGLLPALQKNGAFYEVDIHGQKGGFSMEEILIGYRENQPCPRCSTPIQKIKTGSTSSFICPHCQRI